MNRDQSEAHQQRHTFHSHEHREIGLRAVAAAILYQGSTAGRTMSRDLSARPVSAAPPNDHEP
jgi:hypothetical protein